MPFVIVHTPAPSPLGAVGTKIYAATNADGIVTLLNRCASMDLRKPANDDVKRLLEDWAQTSADGDVLRFVPVNPSIIVVRVDGAIRLDHRQMVMKTKMVETSVAVDSITAVKLDDSVPG